MEFFIQLLSAYLPQKNKIYVISVCMCVSDHCLVSSLYSPVSLKLLADFSQRDNDVPPGFTVMRRGKKPSKASLKKDFIVSSTLVTHQRVQVGLSLY